MRKIKILTEGTGEKKGGGPMDCPHCGMGKREHMMNIRILSMVRPSYECKNCGCQWEVIIPGRIEE